MANNLTGPNSNMTLHYMNLEMMILMNKQNQLDMESKHSSLPTMNKSRGHIRSNSMTWMESMILQDIEYHHWTQIHMYIQRGKASNYSFHLKACTYQVDKHYTLRQSQGRHTPQDKCYPHLHQKDTKTRMDKANKREVRKMDYNFQTHMSCNPNWRTNKRILVHKSFQHH